MNHLVERVQLETGHISLSQLMRFLKSFPAPSSPAMVRVHEEKALPEAERAVRRWVQMCFKGGASRFEVGVELEEIKRQVRRHSLQPSFDVPLSDFPSFPLCVKSDRIALASALPSRPPDESPACVPVPPARTRTRFGRQTDPTGHPDGRRPRVHLRALHGARRLGRKEDYRRVGSKGTSRDGRQAGRVRATGQSRCHFGCTRSGLQNDADH